jgi:hypothetical protein
MLKRWSPEEIAKLRILAGKRSASEIAEELGRAKAATIAKAHELKLSLRVRPSMDPGAAGLDLSG